MADVNSVIVKLQDALTEAQLVASAPKTFDRPNVHFYPINTSKLVALAWQYPGWDRYERFQRHVALTVDKTSVQFYLTNMAAGGSASGQSFAYPKYGVYLASKDQAEAEQLGNLRATYSRVGTERQGQFDILLADEQDGPYLASIVAWDASGNLVSSPVEGLAKFWLWVDRQGNAKNSPWIVDQNGTFDWSHPLEGRTDPPTFVWTIKPKDAYVNPPTYPLEPWTPVVFSDAKPYTAIRLIPLVPMNGDSEMNVHIPQITSRGITVTENTQSYFVDEWVHKVPHCEQLDGPRGIGTINMPTWLRVGRNGKVYGANPWRTFVVDATGTVRTLFGKRHKQATYWEECTELGPEVEIVGQWEEGIPPAEQFAWEPWGGKFRAKSVQIDNSVPAIGGDQPHVAPGPQLFTTDRHGYVLKAQFAKDVHGVPPFVSRFCAASDPWGLDIDDTTDKIYISERKRHALVEIDPDTGNKRDILVNSNGSLYGYVDDNYRRWVWNGVSNTTQAQAAIIQRRKDCQVLAPEGVCVQDGWLYYGAYALGEVRRINLTTGEVQSCCRPYMGDITGNQPHYIFIAISDGTFGPRGTLFVTTFLQAQPVAYLPVQGTDTDGTVLTHNKQWMWCNLGYEVFGGDTGRQDGYQYGMAIDIAKGMVASGSSNRGLFVHILADPVDPLDDTTEYTQIKDGALYYRLHGYDQIWDQLGYARHNVTKPWGEYKNLDMWLQTCGHKYGT